MHREQTWLLGVRAAGVAYAPGRLGLVGGHVEPDAPVLDVLEETGRREVAEEVGLDLTGVPLTYLESEYFVTEGGERQVTVTFLAPAPPGQQPRVADPLELTEVDWWTADRAAADARCPDWLPDLLRRADQALADSERNDDGGRALSPGCGGVPSRAGSPACPAAPG